MPASVDDVLDQLSMLMENLEALLAKISDENERADINEKIVALSKLWCALDNENAAVANDEIDRASASLKDIAMDLKQEKAALKDVARIIQRAAEAVALAEKVMKLAAA